MAELFKIWKKRLVAEFVKKDKTPDFDQGTYVKIKDQWADFVKYKNS